MYQPYPSGGQPVEPLRPPAPAPVQTAVKLMYAGAVIAAVYTIISAVAVNVIKNEVKRSNPKLTTSQLNSEARELIIATIVLGVVFIGLWLWMAWANKQGKNWARITSAVFFGLYTLYLVGIVAETRSVAVVFPALEWLVGLGAIYKLWRPESIAFFKPAGLA
jgi:hypothetical protein